MKKQNLANRIFHTIWVTALGIIFVLPLLWMVSSSLKTGGEVFSPNFQWIPDKIQWVNYFRVWIDSDVPFWKLYCNSLWIAVIGTLGQVIVSSMAGYALGRIPFKGRNAVFLVILVTMMVPVQATLVPRFVLFEGIGLYNTHWALILPSLFNVTSIFLLRQFFMGLPNELMEAAIIDGASYFQIWHTVMMPLTKPAMVTVCVLGFISSWNDYLNALIFLPGQSKFTVSQGVRYWVDITDEYNIIMAAATSAIIPVVILYLFTQKYFVESIATTGVKG
jgi:multiple sugar transport system permease protein